MNVKAIRTQVRKIAASKTFAKVRTVGPFSRIHLEAGVGDHLFRHTIQFFVTDPTGAVVGIARVRSKVSIDDVQAKMTGTFIGEIFDLKGSQLLYSTGTYAGTRLEAAFDLP